MTRIVCDVQSLADFLFFLLTQGSAGHSQRGSRWVLFLKTVANHQSASPPSSTMPRPTSHPSPSVPLFYCSHALVLAAFSVFTSISLFSMVGCESASSTLQWRQIRPSQLCHHKTSFRKVATSSPFQLICRHSESGEEGCLPCSSITSSSPLS